MRDPLRARWLGLGFLTLLAALFGWFNGGEAVAIHLGFVVLYQIPLVALVFVAFLLGMLAMFLVGLKHDLQVRELLRERRFELPPPPARPMYPPHPPPAAPIDFTPPPDPDR